MPSRFFLHPIIENKRSRVIFFIFTLITAVIGGVCWIKVNKTLQLAGLNPNLSPLADYGLIKFVLSGLFRGGFLLVAAIIATAFTARQVVGPIKRIEQWLQDWNDNLNPFPLLVRKNDKFSRLVELLNQLYQKVNRPPSS